MSATPRRTSRWATPDGVSAGSTREIAQLDAGLDQVATRGSVARAGG
jgi:hypothetical protein